MLDGGRRLANGGDVASLATAIALLRLNGKQGWRSHNDNPSNPRAEREQGFSSYH